MTRKFRIGMVLMSIFALTLFTNVFASSDIKINVNGKDITTDVECYIKNDRTMVPVRFIAEELGSEVRYNKDKTYNYNYVYVRAPYDEIGMSMIIGYPVAVISEGTFRSDVAPEIKNGRTMVPLRFIADYLNLDVKWDESTKTVYLTNSNKDPYKNFNEKYFDESAAKKYSDWLMNPNKTQEQFMDAHK